MFIILFVKLPLDGSIANSWVFSKMSEGLVAYQGYFGLCDGILSDFLIKKALS